MANPGARRALVRHFSEKASSAQPKRVRSLLADESHAPDIIAAVTTDDPDTRVGPSLGSGMDPLHGSDDHVSDSPVSVPDFR